MNELWLIAASVGWLVLFNFLRQRSQEHSFLLLWLGIIGTLLLQGAAVINLSQRLGFTKIALAGLISVLLFWGGFHLLCWIASRLWRD